MDAIPARKHSFGPWIVAGAFLLWSLSQITQYGASWDEPLHFSWGKIVASYLSSHDERLLELLSGNGLYYGPLFFLVNYWLTSALYHTFHLPFIAAAHVLTILTASIGVALTFVVARRWTDQRTAIVASLLLTFFPSFLAHSQYNPKDIPLLTATLLSILAFYEAARRRSPMSFALAGTAFGFAVAMKITALVLLPIFACAGIADTLARKALRNIGVRRLVRGALAFAVASPLAMFVFWPLLWFHPSLLPRSIAVFLRGDFWSGQVLYLGTEYPARALPWHYTLVELLIATPLFTIILAALGLAALLRSLTRRERIFEHTLLLSWLFVPLLLSLKPGLARYDGMRQFLFVVPALAIVAAIGCTHLCSLLRRRFGQVRARALSLTAAFALFSWLALEVWRVHPYEGAYVNEAVRWIQPVHLERSLELEYWASSYREGIAWLKGHAEPNAIVCIPVAGNVIPWYEPLRADLRFGCDRPYDYLMYITRFSQLPDQFERQQGQTVFAVSRYHSDLLRIVRTREP